MSREYLDHVVERARSHGQHVHEAIFRASYSIIEHELGRYEQALDAARDAHDVASRTGNPNATAWALLRHGSALAALGEPAATTVLEQSILLAQQTGSTFVAGGGQSALTSELLKRGDVQHAIPIVLDELQGLRRRATSMFLQQKLIGIAITLGAIGSAEDSAFLFGATHRSAAAGSVQAAAELDELRQVLVTRLDDDTLTRLIASGEQLTLEHAATIAERALTELLLE